MSQGRSDEGPHGASSSSSLSLVGDPASAASANATLATPSSATTNAAGASTTTPGTTTTSSSSSSNRRVALGRQGSIRKRNNRSATPSSSSIHPPSSASSRVTIHNPKYYDPRYYYKGGGSYSRLRESPTPTTWAGGLRNLLTALLMVSLPMSIFWLPLLVKRRTHPRVVVALTTTHDRLPHIQPTLESLLLDQSLVPSALYLVLPTSNTNTKSPPPGDPDAPPVAALPSYLTALQEQTALQILTPAEDLGPTLSAAYYALQQETFRSSALSAGDDTTNDDDDAATSDADDTETRILLVHDGYEYPRTTIESLVDASEAHPAAVVAGSGGSLPDAFRFVIVVGGEDDPPEESAAAQRAVPRVVLRPVVVPPGLGAPSTTDGPHRREIVEARMGLVFRAGSLPLDSLADLLHRDDENENDAWPDALRDPSVGDLVWSGLLEARNLTRVVLPRPAHALPSPRGGSGAVVASWDESQKWMETAVALRARLGVWGARAFLDPASLDPSQREAIRCEGEALFPAHPDENLVEDADKEDQDQDQDQDEADESPGEAWEHAIGEACGSTALSLLRDLAPKESGER